MQRLKVFLVLAAAIFVATAASAEQVILPAFRPPTRGDVNCHPSRHNFIPRSPGEETFDDAAHASRLRLQVRAESELKKKFVVKKPTHAKSARCEAAQSARLTKNYQQYLDKQARIWMAANPADAREMPVSTEQQPRIAGAGQRQTTQYARVQNHVRTGT